MIFLLTKYPDDILYYYCTVLFFLLFVCRIYHFVKTKSTIYFTDFCYVGNFVVYFYVYFFRSSRLLFSVAYIYATGILGLASPILQNNFSPHDLDCLTSLYIHSTPATMMFAMRWFTLQKENTAYYYIKDEQIGWDYLL